LVANSPLSKMLGQFLRFWRYTRCKWCQRSVEWHL